SPVFLMAAVLHGYWYRKPAERHLYPATGAMPRFFHAMVLLMYTSFLHAAYPVGQANDCTMMRRILI
ncbi:MAG: hypothetical protein ACSW8A_07015, partial [Lachnospiraceae bacterium]